MDIKTYQRLALTTAKQQETQEAIVNFTLGLVGEAGEVADEIKKAVYHGHGINKDRLCKELGDVCWYLATLSHYLNIPLEEVFEKNIEKLKKRYPEGFSSEASINRIGKEL